MNILGNISSHEFLKDYWEQKPLVIRNAIDPKLFDISKNDLLDMAQDDYFESRLIQEKGKTRKLSIGPIHANQLDDSKKWTLFIHNINYYNDTALALEKSCEFLPKYLFDDVMCSYSSADASVGAHVDPYNVFIVQVEGLREWSLQHDPIIDYKEDDDIKVLKSFHADQTYILNPGDVLYIPAQVAHQGISLEKSVSLSVGFNSFESQTLLQNFVNAIVDNNEDNQLYQNQAGYFQSDTFEISHDFIEDLKVALMENFSEKNLENWLLCQLTKPKKEIFPNDDIVSLKEFLTLCKKQNLCFDEFTRMSALKDGTKMLLTINGELAYLDQNQYKIFREIFINKHQTFQYISSELDEFMYSLYEKGIVFFTEPEH